jgi:hypothetical protein
MIPERKFFSASAQIPKTTQTLPSPPLAANVFPERQYLFRQHAADARRRA